MMFICQILIGLIANLISAVLIYFFLEKRIKKLSDRQRLIGSIKAVKADLDYIEQLSLEIKSKEKDYFKENRTPHCDYPIHALSIFISEATSMFSQADVQSLVNFRENINIVNNFLFKLRNVKTIKEDKEKTIKVRIPQISQNVISVRKIIDKLDIN